MKKIAHLLCLGFLVFSSNLFAQEQSKDVTITTSGSGATQENATQNALRSAIEQAFGTFISARTEILNDELVSDQITSVASGNIKSYEVLNASQLPNGLWGVTLKSVVSVDKLTSFVQAKGVEVEIKGGLFAINIKQQLLNEQAEVNVIADMFSVLHEVLQTAFDYRIETLDPVSVDNESQNWKIPIKISVLTNVNMDFCANYCINVLKKVALAADEIESYSKLHKEVYTYGVFYNNEYHLFHFRKSFSVEILKMMKLMMSSFYCMRFRVDNGLDNLTSYQIKKIHDTKYWELYNKGEDNVTSEFESLFFWDDKKLFFETVDKKIAKDKIPRFLEDANAEYYFFDGGYQLKPFIVFQNSNQTAAKFTFPDYKSLQEIEQLTQYSVHPLKDHSLFKNGGFVVYEKDGHGLICAPFDLGEFNLEKSYDACDKFVLNGFNDWYLPSRMDLAYIYQNLFYLGIGVFHMHENYYWSNEKGEYEQPWIFSFRMGWSTKREEDHPTIWVRPVRKF
jgi:hypothetical protein